MMCGRVVEFRELIKRMFLIYFKGRRGFIINIAGYTIGQIYREPFIISGDPLIRRLMIPRY